VWFFVDSTVADARFFTEDEKAQAVERLRANQTGVGSNEFKWQHIYELFYDIKSLFWVGIALLINAGTAVASSFGPTLINNFGFDKYVKPGLTPYTTSTYSLTLLSGLIPAQRAVRVPPARRDPLLVLGGSEDAIKGHSPGSAPDPRYHRLRPAIPRRHFRQFPPVGRLGSLLPPRIQLWLQPVARVLDGGQHRWAD
jgi:hypothetical protein